jgi:hypothetical protein
MSCGDPRRKGVDDHKGRDGHVRSGSPVNCVICTDHGQPSHDGPDVETTGAEGTGRGLSGSTQRFRPLPYGLDFCTFGLSRASLGERG